MTDSYTQVTRTGYGSRLKNSFAGVIFGILLIIGAIILLWTNEQRSIARQIGLSQAEKSVISISSDQVSEEHNTKLIHTTGQLSADDTLVDDTFWVTTTGLKLHRKVEMYQWKEESHSESQDNLGGSETTTTTYTYDKIWSDSPIDSSYFKKPEWHQNPNSWQHTSMTKTQDTIKIGDIRLTDNFVSQINNYQNMTLDMMDTLTVSSGTGVFVSSSGIYYGENPSIAQIGDLRVRFEEVPEGEVSVMWQYSQWNLVAYTTENGSNITLLDYGYHTAQAMIALEERNNTILTWILRGLWIFLLYLGCNLILGPLVMLAKVVPFISSIIGFGTGLISLLFAFIVWPLVIAIAWMYARPIVSLIVIVFAAGVIWWIVQLQRKKREPKLGE